MKKRHSTVSEASALGDNILLLMGFRFFLAPSNHGIFRQSFQFVIDIKKRDILYMLRFLG